jgi:N utilization substance protein B
MKAGGRTATAKVTATRRRSAARLAAVQALYQAELSATPAARVADEFVAFRLGASAKEMAPGDAGGPDDERDVIDADIAFFSDLVRGVADNEAEIRARIAPVLSASWKYDRLDATLRQVLRAAAYELIARVDLPPAVVIREYVAVADAFFSGQEPGFVNAALDRLARDLRDSVPAGSGRPAEE